MKKNHTNQLFNRDLEILGICWGSRKKIFLVIGFLIGIVMIESRASMFLSSIDDGLLTTSDSTSQSRGSQNGILMEGSLSGIKEVNRPGYSNMEKLFSSNKESEDGAEELKSYSVVSKMTPDNSGLLSMQVNAIFIDSFNIKWFATPLGISRFDNENWDTINTGNYLLNNNVHDLAYERTGYGHELWVATDGGLSVLAFNRLDGVTGATTYHTGNSPVMSDTIQAVGIDTRHNRWIGTPGGLSIFQESEWDSIKLYMDYDRNMRDLAGIDIKDIQSYPKDSMIFVNTHGGGTLRYSRDDVDGITAASSYERFWGGMGTDTVNTVTIVDTVQWFGCNRGAYKHLGNLTKSFWIPYNTETGLIDSYVTATEVDNQGNIWLGTRVGLSVLTPAGFYTYTTDDGLINPVINDIKRDYLENLYLATNGGIEVLSDIPGTFTMAVEPLQASELVLEDIQTREMTVSWTPGEGNFRLVFVRQGSEGAVVPVNNTSYSASSAFGEGSTVNDWYCVYNGSGNTVLITQLDPETDYRVMVCEYGSIKNYITYSTETFYGNVATFKTLVDNIIMHPSDEILICPNPFRDYLHISLYNRNNHAVVSIYTLNGNLIFVEEYDNREIEINTSKIQGGHYILVISTGKRTFSYKLIK
jgi:hypothetical protein